MNLASITTAFDGHRLTTLDIGGRPAWDAKHIGDIVGYGDRGGRLVRKIRSEWLNEFLQGHDYLKVKNTLLLLKPGLDLVLSRTCKPAGKRLRHHIIDEVLPQMTEGLDVPPDSGESTSPFVERERRLRHKLELEDRRYRSATLHHTAQVLRDLGRLSDDDYAVCALAVVEIALGGVPDGLSEKGAA